MQTGHPSKSRGSRRGKPTRRRIILRPTDDQRTFLDRAAAQLGLISPSHVLKFMLSHAMQIRAVGDLNIHDTPTLRPERRSRRIST